MVNFKVCSPLFDTAIISSLSSSIWSPLLKWLYPSRPQPERGAVTEPDRGSSRALLSPEEPATIISACLSPYQSILFFYFNKNTMQIQKKMAKTIRVDLRVSSAIRWPRLPSPIWSERGSWTTVSSPLLLLQLLFPPRSKCCPSNKREWRTFAVAGPSSF